MKFPTFFGINDIKDLIIKKYNQDLLDIRNWWDDHDSGARTWTNVNATNATIASQVAPFLPLSNNANNAAGYLKGTILQSFIQTTTTSSSTTSGSYQGTNSTRAITPKSTTSKILVLVTGVVQNNAIQTGQSETSIDRSGTDLSSNTLFTNFNSGTAIGTINYSVAMAYLDSPATTSSITYTATIRSSAVGVTTTWAVTGTAVMILLELAA